MEAENEERQERKRRANKAWWKRQWPWWRILLAVIFVVAFFSSVEGGVFPSELRTEIPSRYNGYWMLLSTVGLAMFAPLAVGPDWRHQGIWNSILAVGFVVFVCLTFPRNVVARIFVDQEMTIGSGVTVTPTEFQLYSIETLRHRRGGRSYVAHFASINGVTTWRPAGTDIDHAQIGRCVTLNIRRNAEDAMFVEGLDSLGPTSFHDCRHSSGPS